MRQLGHIRRSASPTNDPNSEEACIDLPTWLAYVAATPNFEPLEKMRGRNPFTGQEVIVDLEHSVTVLKDGDAIGRLIWWDGSILVEVNGDHPNEWIAAAAAAVGGTFHKEGSVPPPPPAPRVPRRLRIAVALLALVIVAAITWSLCDARALGAAL